MGAGISSQLPLRPIHVPVVYVGVMMLFSYIVATIVLCVYHVNCSQ